MIGNEGSGLLRGIMHHQGSFTDYIAFFDLRIGAFWLPWYNGGQGGWFDNVGLAALGSFKFRVGLDLNTSDLENEQFISLSGLSDGGAVSADASGLIASGDQVAFGDDTLKYLGDNTYELVAGADGALDGISALKFGFEPLFYQDGGRYSGYELYLADSDGPRFNSGESVTLTHVDVPQGSVLRIGGNDYTSADGWVTPEASRLGQFRLVEDTQGNITVEFRDIQDLYHHHKIPGFEIVQGAGTANEISVSYDPVSFYNIGDSVNAGIGNPSEFTDVATVDGSVAPIMGSPSLYGLMPLDGEGIGVDADGDGVFETYRPTVTPTHVAVGGDWNDPSAWEGGVVPGDGAIVFIPSGVSMTASGQVSGNAHIFMVRVDGELTFTAEGGDTSMLVDTIFSTENSVLRIDADDATLDGDVDIALKAYDLVNGVKDGWGAEALAYYVDTNGVEGWDGLRDIDDGAGVLGRYSWDPSQISLGIVAAGTSDFRGHEKTAHIEHDGLGQGSSSMTLDGVPTGWQVGDRLMIAGTEYGEMVSDGLITEGHEYYASKGDRGDNLTSSASEVIKKLQGQDEVVKISSIVQNDDGTVTLQFDRALQYDHMPREFLSPGAPDVQLNIANLSRNVTIRSAEATTSADSDIQSANSISNELADGDYVYGSTSEFIHNPVNLDGHLTGGTHFLTERGHLMFMHSDDVHVSGIASRALGRTDKTAIVDSESASGPSLDRFGGVLGAAKGGSANGPGEDADSIVNHIGRYGLHLHQAGTQANDGNLGAWLEGNVVEGSVGWGIAQHGSEAILASNITFNTVGSGFMAESGNETGVWFNNLSAGNHGFGVAIDPPAKGATNDFGKNGSAFWFEGRALAVMDNIALSSQNGYFYKPFGVKQTELEAAALTEYQSYFDAVNLHFGLTGEDALTVNADELDSSLESLVGEDGRVIQNGFVPIRYFEGNSVQASSNALAIITLFEQGARKANDAWSLLNDFTAVNVNSGVFMQYTSKYVYDDFFISLNQDRLLAMDVNTAAHELTLSDWIVELDPATANSADAEAIFKNSTRTGNPQRGFSDQVHLHESFEATDLNVQYRGYGALASQWEGFTGNINPALNLLDANFVNILLHDGDTLSNNYSVRSGPIGYDFDYIADEGALAREQILIDTPSDKPIEIELIQDSKNFGLVGLWREQFNTASHYANAFRDEQYGESVIELPHLYFNDIPGERAYGHNWKNGVGDDIWSGILLEFDKTDSLGEKRYSYETVGYEGRTITFLTGGLDSEGNPAKGNVLDALDNDIVRIETNATTGVDEVIITTTSGEQRYEVFSIGPTFVSHREHATTNEKVIVTPELINATLIGMQGYYTIPGMTIINEEGAEEALKFVLVKMPFTDRLTGELESKDLLIALDEAWGEDGSVDWSMMTAQTLDESLITSNTIVSAQYGHYLRGVLQHDANGQDILLSTPTSFLPPDVNVVDGTELRDIFDRSYVDADGDSISDSSEIVLAGAHDSDVVWASGGADTLDGGEGNNDRVHYNDSPIGVSLDISSPGNVQSGGYAEGDVLRGFEVYNLSNHSDSFIGSDGDDIVWPHGGSDIIHTGAGNDSIRVKDNSYKTGENAGLVDVFDHYVDGGDGYDTISLKGGYSHSVTATGDVNEAVNIVNVEHISGHSAADIISVTEEGGIAQQYLERINGAGGDDILIATLEHVTLFGGDGADKFDINPTA